MTATVAGTRVELPRWVGGFGFRRGGERAPRPERATRVGALDLLDPEAGAQIATFGSPADPGVVVFDGYLFDRAKLANELQLQADASDALIAANGFQAWGRRIFERLAGSYLIAIWDARGQQLLLGHDALGRHPVFYSSRPDGLWFGSNVLTLAASGLVSNRLNRLSLAMTALTYWPEAGQTFFAEINRLRAGSYLEVRADGQISERRYWDPLPASDDEYLTEREVLEGFEPRLLEAVGRCMELAPDGIMLSGGVDSVTVAALATRYRLAHGQPPIVAVSGRADLPILQEEHMQTRAAEALSMPHVVSRTSEWTGNQDDVTTSLAVAPELPGPSRIYWVGTYMAFYRMAASHDLHVMLTGSGGDNWLAVADVHAADLIRRLRFAELSRFIRAAARTGGSSYAVAAKRMLWHGGMRPLLDSLAARALPGPKARFHRRRAEAFVPEWLCPDSSLKRELVDRLLARRIPALDASGGMPRNYYEHSVASASNPHLYHEFETAFHVDAMCGLRLLSPYHDRDLVSFFTRIPPAVLVHGNRYKGLLRPVVEKYLPDLGFGQQRKDYPKAALAMDVTNLREGVKRAWPSLQQFHRLESLGIVDSRTVAGEHARADSYGMLPLVRMFALMSAERWVSARLA